MSATHESTAPGGAVAEEAPALQVERILAMTPEAEEFLAELSRRSGLREGEVIRLALGLFGTAIEAREQGKHFGIASASENLDVEIVGF